MESPRSAKPVEYVMEEGLWVRKKGLPPCLCSQEPHEKTLLMKPTHLFLHCASPLMYTSELNMKISFPPWHLYSTHHFSSQQHNVRTRGGTPRPAHRPMKALLSYTTSRSLKEAASSPLQPDLALKQQTKLSTLRFKHKLKIIRVLRHQHPFI